MAIYRDVLTIVGLSPAQRARSVPRLVGLAAALLATALLAVAPGPAAASPVPAGGPGLAAQLAAASDCPFTNTLCLFDEAGYAGARLTLISFAPGGACVSLVAHGWDGRARSALNTHGSSAALFANDDCIGGPYQVAGGAGVPDLGSFAPRSAWVPPYLA